jgi:membrane protein YqaA with SNARE-associated domain
MPTSDPPSQTHDATGGRRSWIWEAVAILALALWSLAEATIFFIVPDVLLTGLIAADRPDARRLIVFGTLRVLVCVFGAVLGGWLLYEMAAADPQATRALVLGVPFITEPLMHRAESMYPSGGLSAMVIGSVTGVPYKLFAVLAGEHNVALTTFLLASVPARAARFVIAAAVAILLRMTLARRWPLRWRIGLVAAVWIVVYALHWSSLG